MTTRSLPLAICILLFTLPGAHAQEAPADSPQQLSFPANAAAPAEHLKLLPGFKAELIYSVPARQQGSWVAMTVDPRGRLIVSDQYGKLYRITLPAVSGQELVVEPINVDIGGAHGLLYAFDSLYVMVNERRGGFYRVRDTDGDDQFDSVELLRRINGGGEHGPHAIVLAPDQQSLYVCGGNHSDIPAPEESRVPRNWQEDQLLPRMWDARGHAVGKLAPGGWICRVHPDGLEFELVSIGYRNEYDIAFNPEGELFAFDADMEWDVGTPWYRPTRVNHVISGSEFGWRSGTGKWPEYYPDSMGSVVDIGPGSPTGIVFGTGAKFPAKYQRALFLADWSYGIIYAVHLKPAGATYVGQAERFVSAAPLPATDMVVNPVDGALYFTVGGRRTQSGLYRITYVGDESTAPAPPDPAGQEARDLRRQLEALHQPFSADAVDQAWPHLASRDRAIRYAARVAIEHQPVSDWQQRALSEKNPVARIQALIALARNGQSALQKPVIQALMDLEWNELDEQSRLDLCRALGLAFIRLGSSDQEADAALRLAVVDYLDKHYPADNYRLNRELCQLLVYLRAPDVVGRTLALLKAAPTQEEQIHYALCLRVLAEGWSPEQRREYFQWFQDAGATRGGASFGGFLRNIRNDAIATLTPPEKEQLSDILDARPTRQEVPTVARTTVVKQWTLDELLPELQKGLKGRSFEKGREYFAQASCYKCHRLAGEGGISGPDLTGVAGRFNQHDLLEAIVEPSKVISDQYQATQFVLADGRTVTGRVVNLSGRGISIMTNMLEPDGQINVERNDVEEILPSPISMMPTGLLDTFDKEEILDLFAYMQAGGDPEHEVFEK